MKDWKGNNIEVGHTVLVYEFLDYFAGCTFNTVRYNNGNFGDIVTTEIPEEYIWKLYNTYVIIGDGEKQEFGLHEIKRIWLNVAEHCLPDPYHKAICIKGISDNREEFMLNYFKVK